MIKPPTRLELLSPARDLACGLAAIDHGADAVYIGAPKFGARAAAGNTIADIERLIAHAHRYWSRVYITLNTILYDNELEEARSIIRQVYDAGADALIIQDMGLLELDLPPIPLFASTQTHNYEIEKIRFLESVGLQRVILARELSLNQLRSIRKSTSIELEFFVHGALCVSFSGHCYLSQAVQGRSANRGECAQLCRLPYTLTDSRGNVLAQNQHLLSLKDLNLSAYLADLIDAGITSFKIEGRLKDPAYVKNITAFYRAKLDALMEGRPEFGRSSSGTTEFFFVPDPGKSFQRGSTEYFLKGRRKDIVSVRTPKSLGAFIGTVETTGDGWFTVSGSEQLHNGDGVCFFNAEDELTGVNINSVDSSRIMPNAMTGLVPGVVLYRNHDHEFTKLLNSDSARRTIGITLTLREWEEGFELQAVDEDGIEVTRRITHAREKAQKPERAAESITSQLSKTGDTIFRVDGITIGFDGAYFLPVSILNRLRRECLSELLQERLRQAPRRLVHLQTNTAPYPAKSLDYSSNVVNAKAEQFYRKHGVEQIERGFELAESTRGMSLMTTRHCLKFQFDMCRGESGSAEELYLSDGTSRYRLDFNCDECVMKIVAP